MENRRIFTPISYKEYESLHFGLFHFLAISLLSPFPFHFLMHFRLHRFLGEAVIWKYYYGMIIITITTILCTFQFFESCIIITITTYIWRFQEESFMGCYGKKFWEKYDGDSFPLLFGNCRAKKNESERRPTNECAHG